MKFLLCLICLITVSCNAVIDPKSETIRSERYDNYRECLGAAIVKAMNLAD